MSISGNAAHSPFARSSRTPPSHASRRLIGRSRISFGLLFTASPISATSSGELSAANDVASTHLPPTHTSRTIRPSHPSRRWRLPFITSRQIVSYAASYSPHVWSPATSFAANTGSSADAASRSPCSYFTSAAFDSCRCAASRPWLPGRLASRLCRMLCDPSHSAFMRKLPPPQPFRSPACACSLRIPLSHSSTLKPRRRAAASMLSLTGVVRSLRIAVVPCSSTNRARRLQNPVRQQWNASRQRKSYSFRFFIRPVSSFRTRGFIARAHWYAEA